MPNDSLPEWEQVLAAAAHLQRIVPEAVLVGGTAAAVYAQHLLSSDADHVVTDLRSRFDEVLVELESVAGWRTARIKRFVQILGSLDGIETGVRQLIREEPLEVVEIRTGREVVRLPTPAEMLRIKGVLTLRRNATRDYLDFVALADHLGGDDFVRALASFDRLYPQANGESAVQQLQIQLAQPLPYDLDEVQLSEYKNLAPRWQEWQVVRTACIRCADLIFDQISGIED